MFMNLHLKNKAGDEIREQKWQIGGGNNSISSIHYPDCRCHISSCKFNNNSCSCWQHCWYLHSVGWCSLLRWCYSINNTHLSGSGWRVEKRKGATGVEEARGGSDCRGNGGRGIGGSGSIPADSRLLLWRARPSGSKATAGDWPPRRTSSKNDTRPWHGVALTPRVHVPGGCADLLRRAITADWSWDSGSGVQHTSVCLD